MQVAIHQEAAEDVQATHRPIALGYIDLERCAGISGRRIAHVAQGTLEVERFAHDVDGVLMLADVAEISIAVVTDQPTVANRPEQGAVGEKPLDASRLQCGQYFFDGIEQGRHLVGASGLERLDPA